MKFYRDKYKSHHWSKGTHYKNKFTFIYQGQYYVEFYKNRILHNSKNAAFISDTGYKVFWLNNECYGDNNTFTKQTWRQFVKLQAFL